MSTCISRHGEFGSHTHTTDPLTCDLCHVFDEDGARQRIAELERQVRTLRQERVCGEPTRHGDDPVGQSG